MVYSIPSLPLSTSFLPVGHELSIPEILFPCQSSSPFRTSRTKVVICFIPPPMNVIPDLLMASKEADSLSSEDSKVLYALKNRDILVETPMGLGAGDGKEKGRGGSVARRNHGRRSHMDHAKERALFDCATGTQLTIQKVLRVVDLRSEGD